MAVMAGGARRLEGPAKLRGETRYTQDLKPFGLLHVKLVLSSYPSARIAGVDRQAAQAVPGVVAVLTAADLPAVEVAGPDQPLASDKVYYVGQPIAAVVGQSEGAAADGAALVAVDYEELPAVTDPYEAMQEAAPKVLEERAEGFDDVSIHGGGDAETEPQARPNNVSSVANQGRGDVAAGLAEAEVLVEGRYLMPGVHQGFIETHVTVAAPEPGGVIAIWSPTQGHRFVRDEVAKVLQVPTGKVRVISMPVGGGFGGKVVLLEPLAALLAKRLGSPVQIALTRSEEFQVGRPAPASYTDLKLGAKRDGTLTALEIGMVWDNGAASGWHAGLAGVLFSSPYLVPNYSYTAYEVSTNKTPVDAYRAPAGTQAFFALESALDELALKLKVDPLELRLKNARREGEKLPDGSRARIGLVDVLEAAGRHPLYTAPVADGEGLGVAVGGWGGAFGAAAAGCRVEPDGSLTVQVGTVDISGSSTGLALIAAETFGVPVERIQVEVADTASAPQGPVAGGSITTGTVGPAVAAAAADARRQLFEIAAEKLEAAAEDLEISDGSVRVKGVPDRKLEIGELAMGGEAHPPVLGQGRTRIERQSPAFTVHLCRVKVDRETGSYRVTGYAAIQDVGRSINPPEIEGQIHGGAVQGLGRAMGEQLHYEAGQLRTGSFLDYELPTADQIPEIDVQVLEIPASTGIGTRGVGEPPAVPGPAALANAIASATGVRVRELPIAAQLLIG
ncbi:MAG: xanthine dehydrogenase family protein molybdopterin-binding subunit [Chloroflexi bacterium]|nr:MAG: xanthine dehydrogenase family protein molybdopterin-binding subunit [Chloroflexota bacterium]